MLRATSVCYFFDILTSKNAPKTLSFVTLLTSKCALRHNSVHFFDIATSKSGPTMVCFVHFDFEMCFAPQSACTFSTSQLPKVVRPWCVLYTFDLEMCFAPQRRALFRHLNFQKWSENGSVLYILTWKCASRHNGVHFFMSHLASWLRTRRFSEPTFRPHRSHKSLEKHSVS